MRDTTARLEPLEPWTSTLFLAAGGMVVAFAVLLGAEAFMGRVAPEDIFGAGGFALAFVGLLGLVPGLVDDAPWLARLGLVSGVVAAVGASVVALGSLGAFVGVFPGGPPAWVSIFSVGLFVGLLVQFPAFGVATLLADGHSRSLGILLLVPTLLFAVMLSGVLDAFVGEAGPFVLGSAQATSLFTIGYRLRTGPVPTGRRDVGPQNDLTPR